MKSLDYYLGYIKGFFIGYIGGKKAGKNFVKLMTLHGGLEHIPTRELQKQMGRSADMMIQRQRLLLAAIALRHMAQTYCQITLPNTMEDVADAVDMKENASPRILAIARSQAVLHALAFYAEDFDGLNIANMREAMEAKGSEHYWHMFEDNKMFYVS